MKSPPGKKKLCWFDDLPMQLPIPTGQLATWVALSPMLRCCCCESGVLMLMFPLIGARMLLISREVATSTGTLCRPTCICLEKNKIDSHETQPTKRGRIVNR
mmetsp:Transcript_11043/g.22557  ORF Transcript_11043/g.22557 Transcript_11043/m.22557 type:complete len:102 (+) Transcript_11043:5124-5429(+)